jgi:hypothetical protein
MRNEQLTVRNASSRVCQALFADPKARSKVRWRVCRRGTHENPLAGAGEYAGAERM